MSECQQSLFSFLLALSLIASAAFTICIPVCLTEENDHMNFTNTYVRIIKGLTKREAEVANYKS